MRKSPVVTFGTRAEPGPVRDIMDVLEGVLGKMVSLVDVLMLYADAGVTVTNAAGGAGTSILSSRVMVDAADAGADQARVVVRGNNSGVGTVQVVVYDVTQSREVCRVTVSGATPTTYAGEWTTFQRSGVDQELELRVIGDGAFDPVLFRVSAQFRTLGAQ